MARALAYLRLSKDAGKSKRGEGIERHERDLARMVPDGLAVEWFRDNDRSASEYATGERPDWQRFLKGVENANPDDVVLCIAVDRLTRTHDEGGRFLKAARSSGVSLLTYRQGQFDLQTANGRSNFWSAVNVAETEAAILSERARSFHADRAKRGGWSGGPRPFGYDYERTDDGEVRKGGTLHVVPEEADLIREAARSLLRGESVRSIASKWNARGVETVRGGRWTPIVVRQLLLGPTIRGKRSHHGTWHDADWPAIIDGETGENVRALLSNPQRMTNAGNTARTNPLVGTVLCGLCGQPLISTLKNREPAMGCRPRGNPESCARETISIKRQPLQDYIESLLVARLVEAPKLLANAKAKQPQGTDDAAGRIAGYRARIQEAEDLWTEGEWSKAKYVEKKRDLEAKISVETSKLGESVHARLLADLPTTEWELENRWRAASLDEQRMILSAVFEWVKVHPHPYRGGRADISRRVTYQFKPLG